MSVADQALFSPVAGVQNSMTTLSKQERLLQQAFKWGNRAFMVPLWRLGLGKLLNMWPDVGGQIMVLEHTGRRSGKTYRTPVNYTIIGEDIYCISGFGAASDWYKNVRQTPEVEVWLPDGWWKGTAEDVSDDPNRVDILRRVLIASGLAAEVFEGINPRTLTDEELGEMVERYRIVRIRRTEARTGPGGPGEFAWIWPLATMALGFLLPCRRKK